MMSLKIIRCIYPAVFFVIMSLIFASISCAKLFISTEVVSGKIISITEDAIIELDDGYSYSPAKEEVTTEVKTHQHVSIRFYTDGEGKRKYIDLVPGKNKLEHIPPPDPKAHLNSKNKL